jgi:hypothetical protein
LDWTGVTRRREFCGPGKNGEHGRRDMTVRELRDKLNRVPERFLNRTVYVRSTSCWMEGDMVGDVNIFRNTKYGGTFLGIGEYHGKDFEQLWPEEAKDDDKRIEGQTQQGS